QINGFIEHCLHTLIISFHISLPSSSLKVGPLPRSGTPQPALPLTSFNWSDQSLIHELNLLIEKKHVIHLLSNTKNWHLH
ncbi:unnamed protein product, partial [Plutella xylostella]